MTQEGNIEEHWGLTTANSSPKSGFSRIRDVVTAMPYVASSSTDPNKQPANSSRRYILAEDLAKNGKPIETGYCKLANGNCIAEITSDVTAVGPLILEIIPTSTSAWVELTCQWLSAMDLTESRRIGIKASLNGPVLNVSLLLIDRDGERWKAPSWSPRPEVEWKFYSLADFYRDPHDSKQNGNGILDQDQISAHVLRVTFIPGFEGVGKRRILKIDQLIRCKK